MFRRRSVAVQSMRACGEQHGEELGTPLMKKRASVLPADTMPVLPPAPTPVMGKRSAASMLGTTLERTNWGKGEPLERLAKAVADWDTKTGPGTLRRTRACR